MENQEKEITIIGVREPSPQATTQVVTAEPERETAVEREDASGRETAEPKDDFLLSQIDEFREKAEQLQRLLRVKEDKAKELQQLVNERADKAEELQQIVNERQEKADGITAEVARQIDGMAQKVDERLEALDAHIDDRMGASMDARMDAIDESLANIRQQNERAERKAQETSAAIADVSGQLQEVKEAAGKLDTMKSEISDKIHTESVQSYRNTQELLKLMNERLNKIDTIEKGVHSVKNMSAAIVVLAVIDLLGVAAAVVLSLGLF